MKSKPAFFCTSCGNESAKWMGRCPYCGSWNTLEETASIEKAVSGTSNMPRTAFSTAKLLNEIESGKEIRFSTGISEFDRVLGGGLVRGSLVLVGGSPGIGKSTLLLQMCGHINADETLLYVSGEESLRQLKLRAKRLGIDGKNLYALSETDLDEIIASAENIKPTVLIIDSIQTLSNSENSSSPGSVSQVKDCTHTLTRLAKNLGFSVLIVGHVNKEGAIAGPKVLEHMVDCVLYFEGDKNMSYRILRSAKNRFGSTNEIGVFEMLELGLKEIPNPSEMLLSGRPENVPGTCVTCVIEGSRPILAEVQALITPTGYNVARRNSNGFDYNRAMLLLAVLEKRGGLAVSGCDAYINVIGGLELDEPAADLAAILAIASSHSDKAIGGDLAAIGEVGLTGEIRAVSSLNQRILEISRLGFKRCILPARVKDTIQNPSGIELISARSIRDAIETVLGAAGR